MQKNYDWCLVNIPMLKKFRLQYILCGPVKFKKQWIVHGIVELYSCWFTLICMLQTTVENLPWPVWATYNFRQLTQIPKREYVNQKLYLSKKWHRKNHAMFSSSLIDKILILWVILIDLYYTFNIAFVLPSRNIIWQDQVSPIP